MPKTVFVVVFFGSILYQRNRILTGQKELECTEGIHIVIVHTQFLTFCRQFSCFWRNYEKIFKSADNCGSMPIFVDGGSSLKSGYI